MRRSAKVALPRPPASRRFYAVGDIHGRRDLLLELLQQIRADQETKAAPSAELVFLGDYVDRGPESAAVIEHLAGLAEAPPEGLAPVFLKGNHEALMQDFLAGGRRSLAWIFNGGDATLASYGVVLEGTGPAELAAARSALAAALPAHHAAFLADLAPYHLAAPYLFVHAGIRPGIPLEEQDEEDLLWIRQPFLTQETALDHFVVHGHSIAPLPELRPHRLGIDTGAFYSGRLTAAVIEEEGVRFLATEGLLDSLKR